MTFERLIRSRFPRPSSLFAFLADVIRNPPANFKWDMDTYGELYDDDNSSKCVGCAATSAVLKMAKKDGDEFTKSINARAAWLNLSYTELNRLEYFFDVLRCGWYWEADAIYDISLPFPTLKWQFLNENKKYWPLNLANLEEYVARLKEKKL